MSNNMSNQPQTLDEIRWILFNDTEDWALTEEDFKKIAALTRREERIKVEARLNGIKFARESASENLTFSGFEDDTNREMNRLISQLRTLDGEENGDE